MGNDIDVAIVGGSFAGLAAGLMLARARRRIVVFDEGHTRNRFADAGHGFFGMDGLPPAEMQRRGQSDLLSYPSARIMAARVNAISGQDGDFIINASENWRAKKVILAHGMRDILPDIPGLATGWGQWAMQCPYCHGYEVADQPTGILMTSATAPHHLTMLRDWTDDLALFCNGHPLPDEARAKAKAWGIPVYDMPVVAIKDDGASRSILLADGVQVQRAVLYLVSQSEPSCDLPAQLGCAMEQGMTGPFVSVDMMQRTSVAGVFAAGDLCRPMYGALFAAADGARAGTATHHALLFPEP
ncbi:NAD(P)/FAD-dependent oxidoreductase [Pseudotabrizicola sp.]|uniref:NAD(P)/FAD-dependent oxidoreductase n=1 Tax=Pseudotabrizicola sp. TaxID=2939647 RepID=UPI002728F441|nr:NAD(P)/FAD-dependent oxidoreductase [Pseudotabrizicola sp.]MDO8883972.1 NAD(P)/FAD-dependent oxidoreductase [Pseudotabrizicola sp.]